MRRSYLVEGLVQGVGFRWFTVRRARELGVTGWVRNLPNGRVEICADAEEDRLRRFESSIRQGPHSSNVTKVDITDSFDEAVPFMTFDIR